MELIQHAVAKGQPSEMRVPGCAACSGVRIFILWQVFCAPSVSACWMLMDGFEYGALHGVV